MAKGRTFDPRCRELARVFLDKYKSRPDFAVLADELAQRIQDSIEDFLDALEHGSRA